MSYKDPKWEVQVGVFPHMSPDNVCYSGENSRYADAKNNVIAFTSPGRTRSAIKSTAGVARTFTSGGFKAEVGASLAASQLYRDHRRQWQLLGCRFAHRAEQRCLGRHCRGHTCCRFLKTKQARYRRVLTKMILKSF